MSAAAERGERQGIQSVELGVRVLTALQSRAGPMTLGEVAQASAMEPSKAHRYLVSLCRTGLASQLPSGRYDFGPTMRRLGASALQRTNEVAVASRLMPLLRDRSGHSVNLTVWGEDGPVVVRWDYGARALPLTVRVGATLPLLASSAGRVFLAVLPEAMTAEAVRAARASESMLRSVRTEVRRTGVAVITGSVIPGISSISAPVRTSADVLPVVLTLVLPDDELTDAARAGLTGQVLECARDITAELGG